VAIQVKPYWKYQDTTPTIVWAARVGARIGLCKRVWQTSQEGDNEKGREANNTLGPVLQKIAVIPRTGNWELGTGNWEQVVL